MASWSSNARQGLPFLLGRNVSAHGAALSPVSHLRFRNAPLLSAASAFALGILLQHFWRPASLLVVACLAMLCTGLVSARRAPRLALLSTLVAWVVLGWACAIMRPPLQPSSAVLHYADGLERVVQGTVVAVTPQHPQVPRGEDPLRWDETRMDLAEESAANSGGEIIDLRLDHLEDVTPDTSTMVPMDGGVRLTVRRDAGARAGDISCGDRLELVSRLRPPPRYRDPGVWQYPDYLAADGVSATGAATLVKRSGRAGASQTCRWETAQRWAAARLDRFAGWQRHLSLPLPLRWTATDAGLLNAMLFGDRTDLQHSLRVQFERTGSFHLFVVAGMHVGFVAAGVYWLLARARVPRPLAALLSFLATAGYALLTGFGDPVQRALWMTGAYLLAQMLSRERRPLNALGLAALVLLAVRPQTLFDSAFQMTVLVILAIAGVAMPLLQRTIQPYLHACRSLQQRRIDQHAPPHVAQFRTSLRFAGELLEGAFGAWCRPVARGLAMLVLAAGELAVLSLIAEMAMALPMAFYFHRVTPLALPANLLVVPVLPLLLASAVLTFIASLLSPWVALLPALVTSALLRWTSLVIGGFGRLPSADLRIGDPSRFAAAAALVLLCAAIVAVRLRPKSLAWAGAALVPLSMAIAVLPYPARLLPGVLEVTAIDVGQGDSLLLVSPNGATMLIDAGGQAGSEQAAHATSFDVGESVVSPYLWSRGLRRLDVLVVTHAHLDHIGGMAAVLQNFRPRELWLSVDADSETLRTLLAEAADRHVLVRHLRRGDRSPWAGGSMEVLNPTPDRPGGSEPVNDDSLVLQAAYGKTTVLLEGDAEHASEDGMLAEHLLRPVTLLKVGHHGSLTSTSEAFLQATHPVAAVISCGRGNRFGHPRPPVLERLQASHVQTARTDTMGATQYLLHADGSYEVHFPPTGSAFVLQR